MGHAVTTQIQPDVRFGPKAAGFPHGGEMTRRAKGAILNPD